MEEMTPAEYLQFASKQKKPKYRNKIQYDENGEKIADSKAEHKRDCELKLLERAGEIRNLDLEFSYELVVRGMLICKYEPDAVYDKKTIDGKWIHIVEDTKGHKKGKKKGKKYGTRTDTYVIKKKLMKAFHGIDIYEHKV